MGHERGADGGRGVASAHRAPEPRTLHLLALKKGCGDVEMSFMRAALAMAATTSWSP